jgi:hypothetical protein
LVATSATRWSIVRLGRLESFLFGDRFDDQITTHLPLGNRAELPAEAIGFLLWYLILLCVGVRPTD